MMKDPQISPWSVNVPGNDQNSTLTSFFPPIQKVSQRLAYKTEKQLNLYTVQTNKLEKQRNHSLSGTQNKPKSKNTKHKHIKLKNYQPQFFEGKSNQTIEGQREVLIDLLGHNLILKYIKKKLNEEINPLYDLIDSITKNHKKQSKVLSFHKMQNQLSHIYYFQQHNLNSSRKQTKEKSKHEASSCQIMEENQFSDNFKQQGPKNVLFPKNLKTKNHNVLRNNDVLIKKYNSLRKYDKGNSNDLYL